MSERRPRVGIIYSDSEKLSNESKFLAHYLCAQLAAKGYSLISMIPQSSDGAPLPSLPNNKRISYIPVGKAKPVEIPVSDISFTYWNELEMCDIIIVTVNTEDTENCGRKISEIFTDRKKVVVFSMQRGVRNCGVLGDCIGGKKNITFIECAVGFGVVLHPRFGAFALTIPKPSIIIERLSKEKMYVADGPVRLLETMEFNVLFKKVLTPYTWGVLIFECLNALNMIRGGTLESTISDPGCRLLFSTMIRENYKILEVAADGGGGWKPDMELMVPWMTPWRLEMVLLLPGPLFRLLAWLVDLPAPPLPSTLLVDCLDGRKSMVAVHLGELVKIAKRNNCHAPVCAAVLSKCLEVEATVGSRRSAQHTQDLLESLRADMWAGGAELRYWAVRATIALSLLALAYFFFVHEQ